MADEKKTVVRRVKAGASGKSQKSSAVAKRTVAKTTTSAAKKPTKTAPKTTEIVEFEGKKVSTALAEKRAKKENKRITKGKSAKRKTFFLFVPIFAVGRYIRDSWHELRETEWPTRRKTWALTIAVLAFTLFFAVFVLFFDWLFNWVVKNIIL